MNLEQFSNEFDTLLNTFSIIKPYGFTQGLELDEYEKSVFLSNAQEELIRNSYKGLNSTGESFEETEILRRYLDKLVKQSSISNTQTLTEGEYIASNSIFFELPTDVMLITYEALKVKLNDSCNTIKEISVIPMRQDEYSLQKDNPFRTPTMKGRTNQAWRMDYGNASVRVVEIVPPKDVEIENYILRYIRKPKPIILVNLNELDIDGYNTKQECELDSIFHRQILELALQKALQSKSIGIQKTN